MKELLQTMLHEQGEFGEVEEFTPTLRGFGVTTRAHPYAERQVGGVLHAEVAAFLFEKIQDLQDEVNRLKQEVQCSKCGLTFSECVC